MRLLFYLGIAVLLGWLWWRELARRRLRQGGPAASATTAPGGRHARTSPAPKAPHEVLGIDPAASPAEIREAYHRLIRGYHPDRVAGAADELQRVAEQRSKELNAAYEAMMRR